MRNKKFYFSLLFFSYFEAEFAIYFCLFGFIFFLDNLFIKKKIAKRKENKITDPSFLIQV